MKNFGIVKSSTRPQEIEITSNNVFIASDIEEYTETIEDHEITGFKYNYICYSKDEYILLMAQNSANVAALREELEATKILLGVE
jgi:hypothetical protein